MRILFTMAHGYLPQGNGGLQKSTDQLARNLMKRGHKIAVLSSLMPNGALGTALRIKLNINRILYGRRLTRDYLLGYPVWRTWFPWGFLKYFPDKEIRYIIEKEKPDIVVVGSGEAVRVASAVAATGVPTIMWLVDVEFQDHGGPLSELTNITCVANSEFTAEKHRKAFGVKSTVIYPLMDLENYRTITKRQNVTFINPSRHKGLDIAIKIASLCPEIPFSFNEAWPFPDISRKEFREKYKALRNVTLAPPEDDTRIVYGKCKILLAPSIWEEGYGRIVTEAQISGIPAVASNRGGLPEAVGEGGILVDPEGPIEDWVVAIRRLWHDDRYYAKMSAAALKHAERPESSVSYKINLWEKILREVCQNRPSDSTDA